MICCSRRYLLRTMSHHTLDSGGSMPRTSKTVRPAVLAMQKKSMEVILRRVEAAADQAASPRAPATIVLRGRLRVGLPSPSAEDRRAELPATDGRSDASG